jgi:uncharacterized protein
MWLKRVGCILIVGVVGCSRREPAGQTTSTNAIVPRNAAEGLVISQIYGGAGSRSAVFNRDYVELFNRSASPVSLAGLQIHVAGSSGDFALAATLPENAVVPPGGYYAVGFAAGEQGADLRVDAASSTITNVLPANGKIALAREAPIDPTQAPDGGTQALGCGRGACESDRIVDLVGYGVASTHEGKSAAPAAGVALAIVRKGAGCVDTENNANDFEAAPPTPRTSRSPAQPCVSAPGDRP